MMTWVNARISAPKQGLTYWVKDTLSSAKYQARWNGPANGWQVVSYDANITPSGNPEFWLDMQ